MASLMSYKVKIGLAPIRRDVTPRPGIFNWEFAEKRGAELVKYIEENFTSENVSFVNVDGVNDRNIIFTEEDAVNIADRFKAEKVDAVLIINCNFGNEDAIAVLAKEMNKPVCIWAPLDDTFCEDGMRYTDSQCGIFGASRQLQRFGVPFSHIETCRVTDSAFAEGFEKFVSVSCMVKNFRGMKIAQVGMRPKPFSSVIYNEGEILQKFGIRSIPINIGVIVDKYNRILAEKDAELEEGAKLLASRYVLDDLTEPMLKKIYAFVIMYEEIFEEYKVHAISAECWTAMQLAVGAMPCTAYSILADMGYIISCESDFHGAITMALLSSATLGKKIPFFGEFTVRHPEEKNTELLWHCGPFAYSLKAEDSQAKAVNMRQWFRVKDGHYTIARFDQDNGKYSILAGEFDTTTGPYTFGTYLWAKFDNLKKWEDKLIDGPYIHHMAEVEGNYEDVIKEFCKYVDGLSLDTVE